LLAGLNSPLCDPITPAFFERLRARARGEFWNEPKIYRAAPSCNWW
jgi:hypothetical protein